MRPKQGERANRIGAAQREFFAMFVSQRFRHHNVIQAKPEVRQQDYRSSSEPVRQHTQDWWKEKLHQGENSAENAKPRCCTGRVAAEKVQNELGQNGSNQAKREHVEHDRDENKRDGRFAWLHGKIDNCRGRRVGRKTEMMQAPVAAVVSTANQMKALGTSASTINLSQNHDTVFVPLAQNGSAREQNPWTRSV